jgi:hypothetical protein
MKRKSVYELRQIGIEGCKTEGSKHYKKADEIEPVDVMYAHDMLEGFCLGNIIKYAIRFKVTRNLQELKKVADYAHIMYGLELETNKIEEVFKNEISSD